jgi:hypothetical protein
MFPVYGGKCLSRKAVPSWWQKYRWWRIGWNRGVEVAETAVKRLLCCGFLRTGKAMRQVYHCWWRICREMFCPCSNITCFTFHVVTDLINALPGSANSPTRNNGSCVLSRWMLQFVVRQQSARQWTGWTEITW